MSYETDTPDPMTFRESSRAERIREGGSDVKDQAAAKEEQIRATTAGGLDSAASSLHEKAEGFSGSPRVASAAHSAAEALESSADYIRENDLRHMMADLMEVVKNNPGPALLGAAAVGFLVGRAFSRD
ncbi:MAG TPA: hypothetical protein VEJ86_12265 [Candidatus Binataceae bacterium]|nr:hypothetical protein [Candidatus Binataceae bacterium]